jgi:hypothetical protein
VGLSAYGHEYTFYAKLISKHINNTISKRSRHMRFVDRFKKSFAQFSATQGTGKILKGAAFVVAGASLVGVAIALFSLGDLAASAIIATAGTNLISAAAASAVALAGTVGGFAAGIVGGASAGLGLAEAGIGVVEKVTGRPNPKGGLLP